MHRWFIKWQGHFFQSKWNSAIMDWTEQTSICHWWEGLTLVMHCWPSGRLILNLPWSNVALPNLSLHMLHMAPISSKRKDYNAGKINGGATRNSESLPREMQGGKKLICLLFLFRAFPRDQRLLLKSVLYTEFPHSPLPPSYLPSLGATNKVPCILWARCFMLLPFRLR